MARVNYALGFRVHSGWAVVVAVAGSPRAPEVLLRRRIEIADRTFPGAVQPYHMARDLAAEGAGIGKAQAHLDRGQQSARKLAFAALRRVTDELKSHEALACGILTGSGRPLSNLAVTLASHAAIHSAEGEFFREAVGDAAERCKLPVRRVKEKELFAVATAEFGSSEAELTQRINQLGKVLGSPWRQDEKYATLVGLLALR